MTERKMLVFRVGDEHFATDIQAVREVIAAPKVSTLPQARPPVVGVFNLRGTIVTALDGARTLGLDAGERAPTRAIVVDARGHLLGLLVTHASEVLTIRDEDVRATPASEGRGARGVATGVVLAGDRPIVLVDLANVLSAHAAEPAVATGVTP